MRPQQTRFQDIITSFNGMYVVFYKAQHVNLHSHYCRDHSAALRRLNMMYGSIVCIISSWWGGRWFDTACGRSNTRGVFAWRIIRFYSLKYSEKYTALCVSLWHILVWLFSFGNLSSPDLNSENKPPLLCVCWFIKTWQTLQLHMLSIEFFLKKSKLKEAIFCLRQF